MRSVVPLILAMFLPISVVGDFYDGTFSSVERQLVHPMQYYKDIKRNLSSTTMIMTMEPYTSLPHQTQQDTIENKTSIDQNQLDPHGSIEDSQFSVVTQTTLRPIGLVNSQSLPNRHDIADLTLEMDERRSTEKELDIRKRAVSTDATTSHPKLRRRTTTKDRNQSEAHIPFRRGKMSDIEAQYNESEHQETVEPESDATTRSHRRRSTTSRHTTRPGTTQRGQSTSANSKSTLRSGRITSMHPESTTRHRRHRTTTLESFFNETNNETHLLALGISDEQSPMNTGQCRAQTGKTCEACVAAGDNCQYSTSTKRCFFSNDFFPDVMEQCEPKTFFSTHTTRTKIALILVTLLSVLLCIATCCMARYMASEKQNVAPPSSAMQPIVYQTSDQPERSNVNLGQPVPVMVPDQSKQPYHSPDQSKQAYHSPDQSIDNMTKSARVMNPGTTVEQFKKSEDRTKSVPISKQQESLPPIPEDQDEGFTEQQEDYDIDSEESNESIDNFSPSSDEQNKVKTIDSTYKK